MVNYQVVLDIQYLRNKGASWAGISRSLTNPQTGKNYDPRTVKKWATEGVTPRAETKVIKRLKTVTKNVRKPKSKLKRKYTKKLGIKTKKKREIIGGGGGYFPDPFPPPEPEPIPEPIPDIEEINLSRYVTDFIERNEMGELNDFTDYLPAIYMDRGHLKLEVTKYYISHNPDIGEWDEEIEAFSFVENETIRTINRFSYPQDAVPEMQSRIQRKFDTYSGQISNRGSEKPILISMEIHSLFWVKRYTNIPIDNTWGE